MGILGQCEVDVLGHGERSGRVRCEVVLRRMGQGCFGCVLLIWDFGAEWTFA